MSIPSRYSAAMSQEHAEIRALAEAAYRALNAEDLDAFVGLIAEDVEFTSMVAEMEGITYRGHDGVRAWWETVRGAFEEVDWEVLDVRGFDDHGVVQIHIAGTLGGVPVEQTMWQAVERREDKVGWWAFARTEDEALEVMRLRESESSTSA